jgi:hypothetical protein
MRKTVYARVSQTGELPADLWWVTKFFKCDFFNYIEIKNYKKWESEKQNKFRKG